MSSKHTITPILGELGALCPAGYALALHIKFTTSAYLFQTYRRDWAEYYTQNGLVLHDPIVRWGFENIGIRTWGSLKENDPHGVLDKAAEFGMAFGTVISIVEGGSRTIGGFARADRDFSSDEVAVLNSCLQKIHHHTIDSKVLSEADHIALKRLSVSLTHD